MPFLINILVVDDDPVICDQVTDLLDKEIFGGYEISIKTESNFDAALARLEYENFDLLILDVYEGTPAEGNPHLSGRDIFEEVKKVAPIVVIFYTGLTSHVEELKSHIVRVVSKHSGDLKQEVQSLIESGIPAMRKRLVGHMTETMRSYFWDFFDQAKKLDFSSGGAVLAEYLMLRRLAATLTRRGARKIFGSTILDDKVHPLEFYVCPPIEMDPFETGDILYNDTGKTFHVVLTPSCDLAHAGKTDFILLTTGNALHDDVAYKDYVEASKSGDKVKKNVARDKLDRIIRSAKGDRYYFLPQNEFIGMPDTVIDFQDVQNYPLVGFSGFKKVAKLDEPFAQDMLARYVRNRNRPGAPDLDAKYLLDRIDKTIAPT